MVCKMNGAVVISWGCFDGVIELLFEPNII